MRITASSHDRSMPLTPALREHIMRRLHFALAPVGDRLPLVQVWVGDENGPRGGTDKYCNIRAELDGQRSVYVRGRHEDLYAAIALASARIGRALVRLVRRKTRGLRRRELAPQPDMQTEQGQGELS